MGAWEMEGRTQCVRPSRTLPPATAPVLPSPPSDRITFSSFGLTSPSTHLWPRFVLALEQCPL